MAADFERIADAEQDCLKSEVPDSAADTEAVENSGYNVAKAVDAKAADWDSADENAEDGACEAVDLVVVGSWNFGDD